MIFCLSEPIFRVLVLRRLHLKDLKIQSGDFSFILCYVHLLEKTATDIMAFHHVTV
jgi:hypothetical protein